jgi:hypothetical protein
LPFDPRVAWAVAVYTALLILPGLAILALAGGGARAGIGRAAPLADRGVQLGLAAGLGLALQPLIYLWAHLLGLPLSRWFWLVLLAASVAVLFWRVRVLRRAGSGDAEISAESEVDPSALHPAHALLAAILVATLLSRWWAARDLLVPSWGDSVHHTMIVRLFTLHQGLVDNWLPLVPLSTFTYHFGFHSGVASLVAVAGIAEAQAVIVAGQVLMVLQVLTAYALVAGITGRPWAGIGAALAAAGLATMPAYYINWGRYTQLAGQVILPVALLGTVWARWSDVPEADFGTGRSPAADSGAGKSPAADSRAGQPPPPDPLPQKGWGSGRFGPPAIMVGGLALTHYIVTAFFVLGCLAWLIAGAGPWTRAGWRPRVGAALGMVVVGAAAALLILPWIPQFAAGPLGGAAVALTTTRVSDPNVYGVAAPWATWNADAIGQNVGWGLVIATGVGLVWGIVRRERTVAFGAVWIGLLILAAYPSLLGLPVTGVLKDAVVALGLYIPAGVIVGGALGDWVASWDHRVPVQRSQVRARVLAFAILFLALGLAWRDRGVVALENALVQPGDLRAMAWLRANTPPDAVFLVSSFPAFGETVLAGDDAGWWLPLLGDGRRSTLPPITYGIERSVEPDYRTRVNRLAELWRADLDTPETRAALAEAGVTHAYVGVTGKALDRAKLAASPHWEGVYDEEGVAIFRFRDEDSAWTPDILGPMTSSRVVLLIPRRESTR